MNKKKLRIGINGFGRIGSVVLRSVLMEKYDVEVVAINTSGKMDINGIAHLFKYDSVYGRIPYSVGAKEAGGAGEIGRMMVGEMEYPVLAEREPKNIAWKRYGVDVVLECTGVFRDAKALDHVKAGAKKVVLSAPAKDAKIPLFVLGVNENNYKGEKLISNGSCTTNCVAPIVKLIDEKIGFQEGVLTTIHAYTADQNIVDGSHSDLRRARAGAVNIVPTTTGAAKSVIGVYPEASGRFAGTAIRVPVICGSYSDLTFKLVRKSTVEEVNQIFEEAAVSSELVGKLRVSYESLVSSDIIGNSASCIIDSRMTKVVSDDMVSIGAWYDNEYGYACRLIEMAMYIGNNSQ
ncbi:type I glyceraldehyde-3-phosphate dehydrogenase [Patescibacteria group bacterium]|nr:type I glyceraldehyde-3-phosphate dehydrogenase [Patescibacteria group bacterium]MCG2702636.1 type I glyceraldehyde-3-phosphate dehydrogenase [Candidatus Parcubacteria bacterium]MBU4209928.1 type I glyceraldehyde-3-phosphate dehydrogenase [Patescibacteria group bacterium]MBU4265470.1 type I glyceraldehyde-3-phosphate dehydrogenase [Patescibacteria group bacterium]MBU4390520.1 type I glyceraldehyde-3-phosphate dehydrogenase [Patescibacteria group bacterium]